MASALTATVVRKQNSERNEMTTFAGFFAYANGMKNLFQDCAVFAHTKHRRTKSITGAIAVATVREAAESPHRYKQ